MVFSVIIVDMRKFQSTTWIYIFFRQLYFYDDNRLKLNNLIWNKFLVFMWTLVTRNEKLFTSEIMIDIWNELSKQFNRICRWWTLELVDRKSPSKFTSKKSHSSRSPHAQPKSETYKLHVLVRSTWSGWILCWMLKTINVMTQFSSIDPTAINHVQKSSQAKLWWRLLVTLYRVTKLHTLSTTWPKK